MARKKAAAKKVETDPVETVEEPAHPRDVVLVRLQRSRILVARDAARNIVAMGEDRMVWPAVRERLADGVTIQQRERGRWVPVTVDRLRRAGEREPERFVG